MKSTDIIKRAAVITKTNRPVILYGPPGVGKSSVWQEVAKVTDREFIDVRAIYFDPTDISGMCFIFNGEVKRTVPELLQGLNDPTKKYLICFDDFLQAPPLTLNAISQLILDRRIGPHVIPDNVYMCAATNDASHKAACNRMPAQLVSRFIRYDMDVDLDAWVGWALNNDIKTEVIAFCRFRPELLYNFDPKTNDQKPYSCPRTLEFLSDLMNAFGPDLIDFETTAGTVGEGFAAEFIGFLRIFKNLPNIDSILLNPTTAAVPDADDVGTIYAVVSALARRASGQTFGRMVDYFNRLPDEFNVLGVSDSVRQCPDVVSSRAFIQWASDHSDVLI